MRIHDLRVGILAYHHEQRLLLRLLRKRRSFTSDEFDRWLIGREYKRRRLYMPAIEGDSFILGVGVNGGTVWAFMLELLQIMMQMGLVTTMRHEGVLSYVIDDHRAARRELAMLEALDRRKRLKS